MSTFHAVVWMDHTEAHVLMFDREHIESQRIQSRTHHKHQGKVGDVAELFGQVAQALAGTREVLLAGPGSARNEFRDWCASHAKAVAGMVVDSVSADHPTDKQLVAMAKQYFKKFDAMAADPVQA
jgi:stalled ribosome rescue protein Dom34